MASKPRGWTGARTPSAIKRVRQSARKAAINQPRRSAAKTLVAKAVRVATNPELGNPAEALAEAMSTLDRAAKMGAIHPNAAARRKSRLARKIAATLGGTTVQTARIAKSTGTAAAQKAAKARVAASKATKAKGPQTAAGKARAALTRTARTEAPRGDDGSAGSAARRGSRGHTRREADAIAEHGRGSQVDQPRRRASRSRSRPRRPRRRLPPPQRRRARRPARRPRRAPSPGPGALRLRRTGASRRRR